MSQVLRRGNHNKFYGRSGVVYPHHSKHECARRQRQIKSGFIAKGQVHAI